MEKTKQPNPQETIDFGMVSNRERDRDRDRERDRDRDGSEGYVDNELATGSVFDF